MPAKNPWQHDVIQLNNKGLDLIHPIEQVDAEHYSRMEDVKSLQEGTITPRPGTSLINSSALNGGTPDEVHSIKNLIDSETASSILIVGSHRSGSALGALWSGTTSFTERDTGFGILPFSMLAWHPRLDQATWIYVSDDTQTRRINVAGTDVKVGIPRPNRHGTNSEYVSIITPVITAVTPTSIYDNSDGSNDTQAQADWFSDASADYTITGNQETILAQKLTQVGEGGAAVDTVELSLFTAGVADTTQTAAAVHKFSSTLDLKSNFSDNSRVEAFVKLSNLASINFVRFTFSMETALTITDVRDNGSGLTQVTAGTHGYSTGDAVGITGGTEGSGTDLNGYYFITVASTTVFTLDGSTFSGASSGGSVVNYSKNAFYSDITPAMLSTSGDLSEDVLTKEQQAASDVDRLRAEYERYKQFLEDLNIKSARELLEKWAKNDEAGFEDFLENYQGDLASNIASDEWFVFSRPKTSFFRSGSNSTKNWSNITGMAIGAQYNDNAAAGAFPIGDRISFAEITMVTSESELNSKLGGQPYDWRYTYYESKTGVESNPSPIMPEGIDIVQQIVTLTLTGISTAICDKLRVYRRGGVTLNWNLVDTINNPGATTTTYVDGKSDLDVLSNRILSTDNYPPLPIPVEVTQLLKFSERFSSSTWVKSGITVKPNVKRAPNGAETADLLTETGNAGAITETLLTSARDASDTTVYTTASIAPSADNLVLIVVTCADFGFTQTRDIDSVTGAGMTWVKVLEKDYHSAAVPKVAIAVFRAMSSSPGSGALTITIDGTASEASWIVTEYDNVDLGGTNGSAAVVQSVANSTDAADNLTVTLASFGSTDNATYGAFGYDSPATFTQGTGFTLSGGETSGDISTGVEFRNDNDTSVDITGSAGSDFMGGIAIEIKRGGGNGDINQTVTTTTGETYFSIYVKAKSITGSGPHIKLFNTISSSDTDTSITLATPNYDRDEGQLGVWERFVITCNSSTTDIGLKIINTGDTIWVWGAQLEEWDAASGFLEPARHVPDLRDISAKETTTTRQLIAGGINIDSGLEGVFALDQFQTSAQVDDTNNTILAILEDGGPPQIQWGPYQGSIIFGIRGYKGSNLVDSGSIYWCKPGQPDHWSPFNQLPITHGGAPLQNGFLYNTHSYVFSRENLYRIDPDPTGRGQFVSWPTPTGMGLRFRWALAVGPKIWFLAKDGIYETTGGPARSITTASMIRPMFEGQTINGISGVDMAGAAEDEMRLEWHAPYLYFMYKNLAGNRAVIRWHHEFGRWEHFTYADAMRMAYSKEDDKVLLYGDNVGQILQSGGTFDDHGTAVDGSFRTGALDQGQPAKQKVYGDIYVEALIPTGETVVVTAFLNDELTSESTQNLAGTNARKRFKITLGKDKIARSISLNFTGINSTGSVACAIHEIGIAYQIDQEAELLWDSYFEDDGSLEDKWITGLYLECDTGGVNKAVAVFVDGVEISSQGSPFTINTSGMKPVKLSFTDPVRGVSMRFTSILVAAKLRDYRWLWEKQPIILQDPFAWDNLGSNLEKYVKGFTIDADTSNQAVTLKLLTNGDESTNALGSDTFVFTHNGRQQSQFAFDDSGANQVLAEVVRLSQTSSNPLQVFNLSWIFDTEPPHKKRWNTQERSFNLPGWGHLRDGYFAIRSAANVTLTVTIDGIAQSSITISNTSSKRVKKYVQFPAYKGKVFQFTMTSTSDFKIYNEDTNINVKAWNSSVGYKQFQLPFEGGTTNP